MFSRKSKSFLLALLICFAGFIFILIWTGVYGKPAKPELPRYFEITDQFESDYSATYKGKDYHVIPPFSFVSHRGDTITQDSVQNNIYIADFFFTRCPGICPVLTEQLKRVAREYKDNDQVKIVSHTIDPEYDTPHIMSRYAKRLDAEFPNWHFVTGSPEDLKHVSSKGYFVTAIPGEDQAMTDHSGKFILMDKNRMVRGYYQGTEPEEVNRMMYDIKILMLEGVGYKRYKQIEYIPPRDQK